MGPFIIAWMVGEGIIVYRSMKRPEAGQRITEAKTVMVPPSPAQLLFASGVFVMLAMLAEVPKARPLAITLAWGFDIAAFMKLFDKASAIDAKKGPWPPAMAPDNVILPTGGWSSGTARKLTKPSTTQDQSPVWKTV